MWRAMAAVARELPSTVRVVVVRAEGPSFSAGLDRGMFTPGGLPGEPGLLELAASPPAALQATISGFQAAFSWLRDPAFVSIAAVQGHAVGAGFQLALACDLRIFADDAQVAMREPSLGLVPDLGGTKPLVDAVGYARALELCLTGRWMGSAEALSTGLAQRVVPGIELMAATDDLVRALLATPAGAAVATKALLIEAGERTYTEQLAAERAAQVARLVDLATQLSALGVPDSPAVGEQ